MHVFSIDMETPPVLTGLRAAGPSACQVGTLPFALLSPTDVGFDLFSRPSSARKRASSRWAWRPARQRCAGRAQPLCRRREPAAVTGRGRTGQTFAQVNRASCECLDAEGVGKSDEMVLDARQLCCTSANTSPCHRFRIAGAPNGRHPSLSDSLNRFGAPSMANFGAAVAGSATFRANCGKQVIRRQCARAGNARPSPAIATVLSER